MATIKELRNAAQAAIDEGIANKAALFKALPIIVELQSAAERAATAAKEGKALVKELAEACGRYGLAHASVFDEGLSESPVGVKSGDLTIDDVTYHFTNGYDSPKRLDGGSLSQNFLETLPQEWVKAGLKIDTTAINRLGVSDEELEKNGLGRPDTFAWVA